MHCTGKQRKPPAGVSSAESGRAARKAASSGDVGVKAAAAATAAARDCSRRCWMKSERGATRDTAGAVRGGLQGELHVGRDCRRR